MYLRSGETIEATPSAQSVRFITTRTTAVWQAVERACTTGDFKPRPSARCASCSFQRVVPEPSAVILSGPRSRRRWRSTAASSATAGA